MENFNFEIVRDSFTVSNIRFFGVVLSVSVLILIVKWTIDLYERDIEDLPVLAALQKDVRVKPEDKGGNAISFQGLSVNSVLDRRKSGEGSEVIKFAPSKENLLASEVSPILLPVDQTNSDKNSVSKSITAALEKLLGVNASPDQIENDNIELHLASYRDADQANAHWFLLQQSSSDLLVNYNHQVTKIENNAGEIYRLRIVGFKSIASAKDMCDRLTERGEKCVPAVGEL